MLDQRRSSGVVPAIPVPARRRIGRYAESVIAVAVVVVLSKLLESQLSDSRLLLLWVMSVYVAWRAGFWTVTVASLTAVLSWDWLVAGDVGRLDFVSGRVLFASAVYVIVSMVLGRTFDSLRAQRRRLVDATNGMLDAMLVLDADDRLRYYNAATRPTAAEIGVDLSAIRGENVWRAVPQLAGTIFETESRRARTERRVIEFEGRFPAADIWLHVRAVPREDGGLTLFAHDITSQERAESDLRRSEQRYRALVEASTVIVWGTNADGVVSDVPVWHEITGQTTEELRQETGWLDAIHPDDRANALARWSEARMNGSRYEMEYRLRQRDGAYRWFRVRAVPIHDGDEILEWVGVLTDSHEAHEASHRHSAVENALAVLGVSLDYEWNLAAVTRLLVPALADYCSVDIVDVAGTLRRVSSTHADPEKERVLRELWSRYPYDANDKVGAPQVIRTGVPQLTPSIDPEAVEAFIQSPEQAAMLRTLAPRSFLCVPMRTRDDVLGALSLVFSDSGRSHTAADQAAVEQVAARAATAIENARLYAEAQSASRAKSDFLATMSHELRTPLNAIAGYAELLMLGVRGPVTENQVRDLSRIRQNQQHLLEIITDILNFSRIEAGRMQYVITEVDVQEVFGRMEGVIEPQARARSITYSCDLSGSGMTVQADREKLEQVLINLLGNAVKFTPAGGDVRLSVVRTGATARIAVRDTGVGIAPEQLESIFEPFVQLEPALTRTSEGTGLGLAISRELTRGMGGELRAESAVGKGSAFYVELPIASHRDAAD